jgi:O-antigen/teichoic acid export membrane protein
MIKNVLANYIGRFWSIFSIFFFVPFYIELLGFENYSIISFTLVIAGLVTFLDAGLTPTLSREFARADKSISEKQQSLSTLENIYILISVFVITLIFLSSDFIGAKWINSQSINPQKIALFVKLMGVEIGFQMLFRFYLGGLFGLEYQVTANILQIAWGMLRNGLIIIPLYFNPSLDLFFIWQALSTIVFTLLIRIILYKFISSKGSQKINFKIEKSVILSIKKFALGMLLISLIAALNTQLDKLILSKLLSIDNLGYYTLAVSLASGLLLVVSPISISILPRFTSLYSSGNFEEVKKLYTFTYTLTVIMLSSIAANLIFYPTYLIWIWTGNISIAENIGSILPIIGFSYTMLSMTVLPYNIAIANGYTFLNNSLGLLSLLITIPGYYFSIKNNGMIGAAWLFCIVQTINTIIYIYFINKKYLNIDFKSLYAKMFILPMLCSILLTYLFSLIPVNFHSQRIFSLLFIGLSTITTMIITAYVILNRNDLSIIRQFIYSKINYEKT